MDKETKAFMDLIKKDIEKYPYDWEWGYSYDNYKLRNHKLNIIIRERNFLTDSINHAYIVPCSFTKKCINLKSKIMKAKLAEEEKHKAGKILNQLMDRNSEKSS